MAATKDSPSVSRAFAHKARRLWLCVAIGGTLFLALFNDRVLNWQAGRNALIQARICAAALEPGPGGDLSESFQRLRRGYDGLTAIATLDVTGHLREVYADDTALVASIRRAFRADEGFVTTTVRTRDRTFSAWLVTVPLTGSRSVTASRIAVLLRSDTYTDAWAASTFILAALAVITALVCAQRLIEWFERGVAAPLQGFLQTSGIHRAPREGLPALPTGGWREMERIAENIRELIMHGHVLERESRHKMDKCRTGLTRQLRRAEDQASRDPLTGLFNRAFLDVQLPAVFERHRAGKDDLSVAMIDLDNFKHLNDSRGHMAGDEVLRYTGQLLEGAIRPSDFAVRFGGDEFVLLLPGCDRDQAVRITRRIVKMFGQYAGTIGAKKALTMSAGVASLKMDRALTGAELVDKADAALYRAKGKGKNAVAVPLGV